MFPALIKSLRPTLLAGAALCALATNHAAAQSSIPYCAYPYYDAYYCQYYSQYYSGYGYPGYEYSGYGYSPWYGWDGGYGPYAYDSAYPFGFGFGLGFNSVIIRDRDRAAHRHRDFREFHRGFAHRNSPAAAPATGTWSAPHAAAPAPGATPRWGGGMAAGGGSRAGAATGGSSGGSSAPSGGGAHSSGGAVWGR